MGYRIVADEHVEPSTRQYLRKLGHDVVWVGDVPELGLGSTDDVIATDSLSENRLVLTQDDDFLTYFHPSDCAGVLYQRDQTLSSRDVGDIVDELSRYVQQSEVTLEYVSRRWL